MKCKSCNGTGQIADYMGLEMRPVGVDCTHCNGTGETQCALAECRSPELCNDFSRCDAMNAQGEHISRPGPKMVPPDHRMKVQYPNGVSREIARLHWQECINRLAGKGCKFFQLDENDQMTVALISGWFEMPRMPDMPYVDRSELVVDQVPATQSATPEE